MNKSKTILILVGLMLTISVYSQKQTPKNLAKFDHRIIHFGFLLGINSADLTLERFAPPEHGADTLFSITPKKASGFNIGIISALHFGEYVSLRFTPNLAFAQRYLEYTFQTVNGTKIFVKDIESTLLNFPLNIKYKSARVNNFSAYVIGGAAYSLDLASNVNAENDVKNLTNTIVKLGKHDIMGQIGFGTDFYLQYFKFGIELKMSYGLKNLMVRETSAFSSPIESLRSKMFLLSFTFEG